MNPETVLLFLWEIFREPLTWMAALTAGFYMVMGVLITIENTLRDSL